MNGGSTHAHVDAGRVLGGDHGHGRRLCRRRRVVPPPLQSVADVPRGIEPVDGPRAGAQPGDGVAPVRSAPAAVDRDPVGGVDLDAGERRPVLVDHGAGDGRRDGTPAQTTGVDAAGQHDGVRAVGVDDDELHLAVGQIEVPGEDDLGGVGRPCRREDPTEPGVGTPVSTREVDARQHAVRPDEEDAIAGRRPAQRALGALGVRQPGAVLRERTTGDVHVEPAAAVGRGAAARPGVRVAEVGVAGARRRVADVLDVVARSLALPRPVRAHREQATLVVQTLGVEADPVPIRRERRCHVGTVVGGQLAQPIAVGVDDVHLDPGQPAAGAERDPPIGRDRGVADDLREHVGRDDHPACGAVGLDQLEPVGDEGDRSVEPGERLGGRRTARRRGHAGQHARHDQGGHRRHASSTARATSPHVGQIAHDPAFPPVRPDPHQVGGRYHGRRGRPAAGSRSARNRGPWPNVERSCTPACSPRSA